MFLEEAEEFRLFDSIDFNHGGIYSQLAIGVKIGIEVVVDDDDRHSGIDIIMLERKVIERGRIESASLHLFAKIEKLLHYPRSAQMILILLALKYYIAQRIENK